MHYCKKCGTQLGSDEIACPKCGMRYKHCSYCGTELKMNATACPSCGAPVISAEAAVPPLETQSASAQESAGAITKEASASGSNFMKMLIAGVVIIAILVMFAIKSDTDKSAGVNQESSSTTTNTVPAKQSETINVQKKSYPEQLVQVYNSGGLNVLLDKDSINLTEDGVFIKFTFSIYMENDAARKIYDNFYHVKGTQIATYHVIASKTRGRFAYLSKSVVDNNGRTLFLWNEPNPNAPEMEDMSQNERVQKCFDLAIRTYLDSQD